MPDYSLRDWLSIGIGFIAMIIFPIVIITWSVYEASNI